MYLNKVYLIGNLTRDPELKALPSGTKVASFSIATNRTWRDKDGAKQEAVEFHNIVVFAKIAEVCAQYLKKGSQALVEGRLQTRSWEDATTKAKKYRTEIVAESVQFGSKPVGTKPTEKENDGIDTEYPDEGGQPAPATPPSGEMNPDDIPF